MTTSRVKVFVEACYACIEACNKCAISGSKEKEVLRMAACIQLCIDCASLCDVTADLALKKSKNTHRFCRICIDACISCAAECEEHAKAGLEYCRECAEACRKCIEAYDAMLYVA